MTDRHDITRFGLNVDRVVDTAEHTRRRMVELSIPANANVPLLVERIGEEMAESERLRQAIRDRTADTHVMGEPGAYEWLEWAWDLLGERPAHAMPERVSDHERTET